MHLFVIEKGVQVPKVVMQECIQHRTIEIVEKHVPILQTDEEIVQLPEVMTHQEIQDQFQDHTDPRKGGRCPEGASGGEACQEAKDHTCD